MHRGTKLIALAALGALAIPVPSQAVQVGVSGDIIKEVIVKAQVQKLGSTKKGTFQLTFRQAQGVSFVKPPLGTQPDKFAFDAHIGEGLPPAGLPRFSGCMTLKITGVVQQVDECAIHGGSASLEAEPGLTAVSVGATMGPDNDWRTTFSLDIEANDSAPTQESVERTTDVRPTTKAGGGLDIEAAEGIRRSAILRGGIIYDTTPGADAIVFIHGTETVTVRQYFQATTIVDRQAVACGGGDSKGIPVGAETLGVHPDLNGDGQGEYIAIPPGCHPDKELGDINNTTPGPVPDLP